MDTHNTAETVAGGHDALRRLGDFAPATAASSSSRLIFDRPGMSSLAARACSSALESADRSSEELDLGRLRADPLSPEAAAAGFDLPSPVLLVKRTPGR